MSSDNALTFTQAAADKVFSLMQEEENYDLKLRVSISGGGCSGFQYGFSFDEVIHEDDYVITKEAIDPKTGNEGEVQLVVNAMCMPYIEGSEIDYHEDLQGAQFIIRNPKAKGTCGCGSSFSV